MPAITAVVNLSHALVGAGHACDLGPVNLSQAPVGAGHACDLGCGES